MQIGETKIDTTTNHPFWVVGYGFKEAGDLGTGEKVLTATGEIKTITGVEVEELETPVTVYNFEVKDWHTYYVSELEVLVHNMCEVAGNTKSAGESVSNTVNPNDIRFSQSSVNGSAEIVESMRNNGWAGDPIDVVRMPDGGLTTIDNTRVVAARQAGIDVQAFSP